MAGARLHDVFVQRINDLRTTSAKLATADKGGGPRVWQVPSDWVGDPFAIPQHHLPSFDRSEINGNYAEVHADDGGGVGDAASLKIQLDYIAVAERAFRYRHASRIRGIMHAAGRHGGHGSGAGTFSQVRNYAQELIKSAGG